MFIFIFERERDRETERQRDREWGGIKRRGDGRFQAGSALSAQSPTQGSNSQNTRS